MTKTTTNVIGIIIVILAGIYFYVTYCSNCGKQDDEAAAVYNKNPCLLASGELVSEYTAYCKKQMNCNLKQALIINST